MSDTLPMFPLNAVIFPGRERAAQRLRGPLPRAGAPPAARRGPDPAAVRLGRASARATRSATTAPQSLFRVGCRVQLTEVESPPDGTFYDRRRRARPDPARAARHHRHLPGRPRRRPARDPARRSTRSCSSGPAGAFTAYRAALAEIRADPYTGDLPQDPSYLSWTLAACAPLPLHERQALLEAEDAADRLRLVTDLLRTELRAMNVIPSLPATDVARTRWSPN